MSKMLSSWKEIAHFFGKGVRTVQRWEKTLNLPIRRPPGAPSNVVLARTSELEEWMQRSSGKAALMSAEDIGVANEAVLVLELQSEVRALIVHAGGTAAETELAADTSLAERLRSLLEEVKFADSLVLQGEPRLRKVA